MANNPTLVGGNQVLPYYDTFIDAVTEDTGGGVYALRTTGGGGGGGDATAANQLTQIAAEQAIAIDTSMMTGQLADIRLSDMNIETATASIQSTNASILANTGTANGYLSTIDADTTNINANIAQLKGSLVTMASVRWNSGIAAVVPSARMVVAFIDRATGNTVNPYTLTAGAQAHLVASEKLASLQTTISPSVITYTNCVAIGASRTYTALEAGLLDIDIYYAGAH